MASIGDLEVTLRLKDEVSKSLSKLKSELNKLDKSTEGMSGSWEGSFSKMKTAANLALQSLKGLEAEVKSANFDVKGGQGIDKIATRIEALLRLMRTAGEYGRPATPLMNGIAGDFTNLSKGMQQLKELTRLVNEAKNNMSDLRSLKVSGNIVGNMQATYATLSRLRSAAFTSLSEKGFISDSLLANLAKFEERLQRDIFVVRQFQAACNESTAVQNMVNNFDKLNKSASTTSRIMEELKYKIGALAGLYSIENIAKSIITIGGEIDQQHIALRAIIGDVQKADTLFGQIKNLALQSPFTFGELNRDIKQLAAYGVEYDKIYDTSKRLADISAGLGVSFERIALAYGQTKARSWLDAKELRQFAYAGIPMLQRLADMYSNTRGKKFSTAEVTKMIKNREVSFEDVQSVLWNMTDAGGQFYNMQLVLSDTLLGKWNKLRDAWEIMMSDFASSENIIGKIFKGMLSMSTSVLMNFGKLSNLMVTGIGAFLVGKGINTTRTNGTAVFGGSSLKQLSALRKIELNNTKATVARLLEEKKITEEHAKQIIALKEQTLQRIKVKGSVAMELATQQKFTPLQLQRLYREKEITAAQIKRLELAGLLSAKESELIVKSGIWAKAQLFAMTKLSGLVALFSKTNLALTGISLLAAGFMNYKQWAEGVENSTKEAAANAKKTAEELDSALKSYSGKAATEETVSGLKEVLKQSGLYTQSIDDQVQRAKTLAEKYDILIKKIKEAKESNERMSPFDKSAAEVIKRSAYYNVEHGYSPLFHNNGLKDDITTNIKDYNDFVGKVQVALAGNADYARLLKAEIDNIIKSTKDISLKKALDGASFEEQLAILANSKYWNDIVKNIDSTNKGFKSFSKDLKKSINKMTDEWGAVTQDNIPAMAKAIKSELNLTKKDVKDFSEDNKKAIKSMIENVANSISFGSDELRLKFVNALGSVFGMPLLGGQQQAEDKRSREYQDQTNVGKQIMAAVIKAYGRVGKNPYLSVKDVNQIAPEGAGFAEAASNISNKYKKAKEELDAATKAGVKDLSRLSFEVERWSKVANAAGVDISDKKKDKNTSSTESDKELKSFNKRYAALEKYISLYKTYRELYGEEEANAKIKADTKDIFGDGFDFSKPLEVRKKLTEEIEKLYKAKKTDDRQTALQTAQEKNLNEQLDMEKERLQGIVKLYDELNNKVKSYYSSRDSYIAKVGLAKANSISGIGKKEGTQFSTYEEKLMHDLDTLALEKGKSADDVYGMSNDTLERLFGKNHPIFNVIKELKDERERLAKESGDAIVDQLSSLKSEAAEIERIYGELQHTLGNIDKNTTASDGEKEEAKRIARLNAETKLLQISTQYVDFFNNAWTLSSSQIDTAAEVIKNNLNKQLQAGLITMEDYRKEMEKILEVQKKSKEVGFLGSDAKSSLNSYAKGGLSDLIANITEKSADASVEAQKAMEGGDGEGWIKNGKRADDLKDLAKKLQSFSNGLSVASDIIQVVNGVFDGLSEATRSLAEMFEALGNEDAANFFSDFNDVVEGIGSIFTGPSNLIKAALDGDIAGIISNAISAPVTMITGPITAFAKLHDKKLQREIEASEQRQKEAEKIFNNLKSVFDKTLGGGYTDSSYANESFEALKKQREELQKQYDAENKKKNKDDSRISDYKQQLFELDEQLKSFYEDIAKELYGLDLEGWSKTLADALVSAWQNGTDAAKAYADAVDDIMKNVVVSVITQKYLEKAFNNLNLDELIANSVENGTDLTDEEIKNISDRLESVGGITVNTITNLLDKLEGQGVISKGKSGNGTLSSNIQNITESTADILASYLNSIRLYVAQDNLALTTFFGTTIPEMNEVAQSQLTQLNAIAENTRRNAQAAETMQGAVANMDSILVAVTNGTKKISVQ